VVAQWSNDTRVLVRSTREIKAAAPRKAP
jgi:hypothetical protein